MLHVTPAYAPAYKFGGPIHSIHGLNKALARKGIHVHTLTTSAGLEDRPDLVQGGWIDLDGVLVKYCKYFGYVHYTFAPQMVRELMTGVRRFDVVHISPIWNFPILIAALTALIHRIPLIISPRGTLYEETIRIKSSTAKRAYYHMVAKHYVRRADALHFTTQDEEEKVREYLKLKNVAYVIPNGVDPSQFEGLHGRSFSDFFPVLQGRRYILFLGRISRKKGLDLLTTAFREIAKTFPDIFLVIAGPDDEGYGGQVMAWLKRDGFLERAVFTGMLTGESKLAAYRDAMMFVLSSYSENFGMSVIEAMSCGTPVVISDKVGIHREVAAYKAGIVVKTTAESLSLGMRELITRGDLRRELASEGKRIVEKYYNIDAVADMMISAYEEIIARKSNHDLPADRREANAGR